MANRNYLYFSNQNNQKRTNPLIKGLIFSSISFVYILIFIFLFNKQIASSVKEMGLFYEFSFHVMNLFSLYSFVFLGFRNIYIGLSGRDPFPSHTPLNHSQLSNINRMIEYRSSIFGTMSPREAMDLMIKTRVLDGARNYPNMSNNERRVVENLNGKLGAMNLQDGIEFLKGGK